MQIFKQTFQSEYHAKIQATQIHVLHIKNKQYFDALLYSGSDVSLIHTRIYNSLKEKPKLKEQSAFLQSVKGNSVSVDGYASMK